MALDKRSSVRRYPSQYAPLLLLRSRPRLRPEPGTALHYSTLEYRTLPNPRWATGTAANEHAGRNARLRPYFYLSV
jgi:hypothetical protein